MYINWESKKISRVWKIDKFWTRQVQNKFVKKLQDLLKNRFVKISRISK